MGQTTIFLVMRYNNIFLRIIRYNQTWGIWAKLGLWVTAPQRIGLQIAIHRNPAAGSCDGLKSQVVVAEIRAWEALKAQRNR